MKAKLAIATVIGLVVCNVVLAQNNAADAKPAAAPTPTAAPADDKPLAAPAVQVAAADDNAVPAPTPPTTPPAPPTPPVDEKPAPIAPPEPAIATTRGAVIPLIQFQGVPLTTAIENLARQANLNYILDPKVGYGQPGEKGEPIKPEPNISVRWENLTAEQALLGLLSTYGLQVVDDPKTKIARVTVKDPAALEPLLTKVIQLKFAPPSNIVVAVQTVIDPKRSRVVPDNRTSQLVVSATEKDLNAVDQLIASLDTQTKQVLIEAKILETTLSPSTTKGIDWSGTLKQQNVRFGNNVDGGQGGRYSHTRTYTTNGALGGFDVLNTFGANNTINNPGLLADTAKGFNPSTFFLDADGVSAAISFLNVSGDTKVISEPRVVTLDNQKATIDVGLLFPIVNTTAGTANTTGGYSIAYSNLTVNLDVTPRIAANNFIELKVQQAVLRLGPDFSSTVGGVANIVNSFFTRKLDTSVLIPSGNTLVMGGLIQDQTGSSNTKVPILGDIPFVGLLFRKDGKSLDRQNLTIFITPTVVADSDFQPTQTTYLKTTGKEETKEDWSAWDSGKPLDWKHASTGKTKDQ